MHGTKTWFQLVIWRHRAETVQVHNCNKAKILTNTIKQEKEIDFGAEEETIIFINRWYNYLHKKSKRIHKWLEQMVSSARLLDKHLLAWLSGLSVSLWTRSHLFDSHSRACVWVGARSQLGDTWEATTHWCFSPSLFPPSPSLK